MKHDPPGWMTAALPTILALALPAIAAADGSGEADLLLGFVHPPVVFGPGPQYGPDKRNSDSVEAELLRQGFARAAIPEFILFGGGAANACCVYQKAIKPGEKVAFGKWGVLLF